MRKTQYSFLLFLFSLAFLTGAQAQTALQFMPITPCRLLDTRNPGSGGPLIGGQQVTVQVQGSCEIPSTAQAYSFNVTVVPHGLLNYLTLWPAGQNQPGVSTLNSYDGRIKAVAAIIPAGTGGAIDAYATNTTDLILDIDGYFLSGTGLAFYPLTPCRLYDTRGGQYLHAMQTVNFAIQGGVCGIPSTASAYSLNFTALPRTRSLNYLTAWPDGQPMPMTSTLNAPTGAVTANAALVQEGTSGEISVFAFNDTDLLIDANGYFAAPGSPGQLSLYSLTPCRALDTRPMYFQGQRTVQMATSPCSVPGTAQAYVVNATVLPQTTLGYLTLWGQGTQPQVSTLNASDGAVTSNLAIVPASAFSGTFQAYASNNTQMLIDVFGFLAPPANLNGNYALAINGYQNGAPFFMAGSLVADGAGNITGGILDLNTGSGSPMAGTPITTGTYSIGANGLGTMSLTTGTLGTLNFHVSISAAGQGQIIWDNADPNPRGSGLLLLQRPQDFYPPQPGAFAIGSLGADASHNRYASAGAFTVITGGLVNSGSENVNDNGTLGSRTFTGSFSGINARSGRGQAMFTLNGVNNNYAYYTVAQGHVLLIGIDPLAANDPLTLGTILVQQTEAFTNASLQGLSLVETTGLAPNGADVVLGLANWGTGSGSGSFSLDENQGGTITQQQASQGTYSVAANGKVTLTGFGGNPPILYLVSSDQAFILGQTSTVAFGVLEPQSASTFTNASIIGDYFGGTINPAQSSIVDSVAYLVADGNGNIIGMANTSGPSGTGMLTYSATYQVDSTGRAVVTGTPAGIMYVVSPTKVVLLPSGNTPALNVF